MNLRLKVFLPLLILGGLAQAYLLLGWLPDTVNSQWTQDVAKIDAHLQSLASTLLIPVLDTDLAAIYGTLNGVMSENVYWKQLLLIDARGRVLYPLDPLGGSEHGLQVLRRDIDYLGDSVAQLVLHVDVGSQVADRLESLHRLTWTVLALIAAFVLATGVVIEAFVRRPVVRLSEASRRLQEGDFAVTLPSPSGDEVGRLVSSFQSMRASIQHYQDDLQRQIRERERAERIQSGRSRLLERLAAGASLDEVLTILVEDVEDIEPDMYCSVLVLDESGRHLRHGAAPSLPDFYNQAVDGMQIGPHAGSCGTAAFTGQRVVVQDIQIDPDWVEFADVARRAGLSACWSQPIVSEDRVLGTFAMYYGKPCLPTPQQLEAIEGAAALAGIAIERTRTETALRESEHRFRALYDENPSMFFTVDCDAAIVSANDFAGEQLGRTREELAGMSWLALHHDDDREMASEQLRQCLQAPGRVFHWEVRKLRGDGTTLWMRESARAVNASNGGLEMLVVCEDITEAHRLSEELTHQATHDALTGLINRRHFESRLGRVLETARDKDTENALCYLDLDQFKIINDTCGHVAGDELLRQLGALLSARVRERDTLARLGGDEFAVLMEHCALEQAWRVADELRRAVDEFHFVWDEKVFDVGVSIGMVPITRASGSPTAVLTAADNACYAAKEQGRNRIHLYREDDAELAQRLSEMQWISRITHALDEDRFELWTQAILPLSAEPGPREASAHHELLLRMRDEDDRLVPPGAFLPAAERYHLAPRLDRWVLATALRWLTRIPEHQEEPGIWAVNLSGLSLGEDSFLPFVVEQFRSATVSPDRICFEITETAAITNLASASQFIKSLKELGCRFALDDFGSGISSFAYLKNLPVDYLKIDGIFVKGIVDDPIDFAMVKSINEIGHVMGKQTIAEFVENAAILEKLREIGVDYAQGYGIGHPRALEPMPGSTFKKLERSA